MSRRRIIGIDDSNPGHIAPTFVPVLLDTIGDFTWGFCHEFFITCRHGNFIYSSPEYSGGENTIRRTRHSLDSWMQTVVGGFGRDKGEHIIGRYCNSQVRCI